MDATLRSLPVPELRQARPYLKLEVRRSTVGRVAELYRDLAVTCIETQTTRVLVIAGDDDPAGERALRVALTTMVLAGLPFGFRLALVALPGAGRAYRSAPQDFAAAGINCAMFDHEESAARWLGGRV